MTTSQRVVLAGFGNVGRGLARYLDACDGWVAPDVQVAITAVSDLRAGTVIDENGLDPAALVSAASSDHGFAGLPGHRPDLDVFGTIAKAPGDVFIEVTFTDLETGEPATAHIEAALEAGMHVSTTNKGPIALHLDRLEALARDRGLWLEYEGTVMSGSAALLLARSSIRHAGFRGAVGILNGTTNYLITRMEQGTGFDEALADAQAKGYAEADPSGDMDGHDAAAKLVILSRVLTGLQLELGDVEQVSLRELDQSDVAGAVAEGDRWRYVATLEPDGAGWRAAVGPRRLPGDHPLASVQGATNALTYHTEALGDVTLIGPGAGRTETAYALVTDLLNIAERKRG